jgi:hypothetical protein
MPIDRGMSGSALPCVDKKGRLKTAACQRERSFFRTGDMTRSFSPSDDLEKKLAADGRNWPCIVAGTAGFKARLFFIPYEMGPRVALPSPHLSQIGSGAIWYPPHRGLDTASDKIEKPRLRGERARCLRISRLACYGPGLMGSRRAPASSGKRRNEPCRSTSVLARSHRRWR